MSSNETSKAKLSGRVGIVGTRHRGEKNFGKMLKDKKLYILVVTTIDYIHYETIIPALKASVKVLAEKLMTTYGFILLVDITNQILDTLKICKTILKTVREAEGFLTALFNYQYNPVHYIVAEIISRSDIRQVKSVHFEWLLVNRTPSTEPTTFEGGICIRAAVEVSWFTSRLTMYVCPFFRLFAVYGAENGKKSGWTRSYDRASGAKEAEDDPFTAHLEDEKGLKGLYHDDNILISIAVGRVKLMCFKCYHRDIYVIADDIAIEDDISVLVYYESGVSITYHLTAYSVSYSSADQRDRALAMTVGSAANESFKADKQFFIKELLGIRTL
nr:hypothetical protein L203_03643 [Cryptococcus depauperatus CBS 7841]